MFLNMSSRGGKAIVPCLLWSKQVKKTDIHILDLGGATTRIYTATMDAETSWTAIQAMFGNDELARLVEHQIQSYNDCVTNKIPEIIASYNPITAWHEYHESCGKYKYEVQMHVEDVTFRKPRLEETSGRVKTMLCNEARLRNFSYTAGMFVSLRFVVRVYEGASFERIGSTHEWSFKNVPYGNIAVMVGSALCTLKDMKLPPKDLHECERDPGGYFIIHGGERVLLAEEKVADNRIMVYCSKKQPKWPYTAEIKSLSEKHSMTPKKLELKLLSKFNGAGFPIVATLPTTKDGLELPVCVLLRALGVTTDADMFQLIWQGREADCQEAMGIFKGSILECANLGIWSQDQAKEFIQKLLPHHARLNHVLEEDVLPGAGPSPVRKAYTVGRMIARLLDVYTGKADPDDRDAYPNKRVVLTGTLLAQKFRQLYQKACRDMKNKLSHECTVGATWKTEGRFKDLVNMTNLYKVLRMTVVESKLKQAISTGNFAAEGSVSNTKNGVSQVLNRISYHATISHLRRIQTPVEKTGKLLLPRKLHGTAWGYICPCETPEGHGVGIVKSIAMGASISMGFPAQPVLDTLAGMTDTLQTIEEVPYASLSPRHVFVYVNGAPIAVTTQPAEVVARLRGFKHSGVWHPHTTIAWDIHHNAIEIELDVGRLVRPLFRLPLTDKAHEVLRTLCTKGPTSVPWLSVVQHCMEYVSPLESEHALIAMDAKELEAGAADTARGMVRRYTHCELHPSFMLGYMAAIIPFPDHNQSPRNCYSSAMSKQAVSVFCSNPQDRFDKNGYFLVNPQRPLVATRFMDLMKLETMPHGFNATVAIMCYSGYNQEDSIVVNAGALKRGMFHNLYYSMYRDEEHANVSTGKDEHFIKPDPASTRGMVRDGSYDALQDDGSPKLHAMVKPDDIVIGKVVAMRDGSPHKDVSTAYRGSEDARVDAVVRCRNSDGYPSVKIRLCAYRVPEIADKLASTCAQKGTIGIILPESDMPFTADGRKPDLIINPHAIPSRMTIGQLMETLTGKACLHYGTLGDGTPFSHLTATELNKVLLHAGYDPQGDEVMYNGQTGQQLNCKIFMGPTYYMRLKHMVADKAHSRASGRVVMLTRQPCEGRSHDGGLRVGEMERDVLIAHGAATMVKERLMDVSDPYDTIVCRLCGGTPVFTMGQGPHATHTVYCRRCENRTDFAKVRMPYACKLAMQEMESMHIQPKVVAP